MNNGMRNNDTVIENIFNNEMRKTTIKQHTKLQILCTNQVYYLSLKKTRTI